MDYSHEFGTVNILLESEFETRGVDSFIISLIKVERQIRRIFTFLIYQDDHFDDYVDVNELRKILADNGKLYFENFVNGIDKILEKSIREIYGVDYDSDLELLKEYTKDRNKIFHGQLTKSGLSREDLIERVDVMKKWSERISMTFTKEIGYDGFGRNSYRKSAIKVNLDESVDFSSLSKYEDFLKTIDRSKKKKAQPTTKAKFHGR